MKRKSSNVAFGGIVAALALALMFFTGIFPFATYALPALAGLLLVVIVIDYGIRWAFSVYIAISVLSILITPDREAAVMFVMFFGYYPILKSLLERLKSRVIEFVLKFAVFNAAVISAYYIVLYVLGMPDLLNEIGELGPYGVWILLGLGNITFLIYDIALSRVIAVYLRWFKPKVLKKIGIR